MKKNELIEEIKFESVEDLFRYISPWENKFNLESFVFRGHSDEKYELTPSALRKDGINKILKTQLLKEQFNKIPIFGPCINNLESIRKDIELRIIKEFYTLADRKGLEVPISDGLRQNFMKMQINMPNEWIPKELYEITALAQHYGIPTRFLDWTYDIYVALFFAFSNSIEKNEGNLIIWALNIFLIENIQLTSKDMKLKFITPHYSKNPNLNAQKGLFTHWPTLVNKFDFSIPVDLTPLDELIINTPSIQNYIHRNSILKKIILPQSEAKKGMNILKQLGYDHSRIYPGYKGVADTVLNRGIYL